MSGPDPIEPDLIEPDLIEPDLIEPDLIEHVTVAEHAGEPVELHTRRWHGGDERPLVLVHGLASNARLWDGVATALVAAGHPVVTIDQRGHGRSSKPDPAHPDDNPYAMDVVTDDLRVLIEATGFDRPVVAGQSWGGNVVVELAARFPGLTAGVVGVDGGTIELASRFPDWAEAARVLAPPPLAGTPRADLEAMLRRAHPDWPESGIQGTLACFEVRDDGTVAPWLTLERHLLVLRGLWAHRPAERFAAVTDPVLLIAAHAPDGDAAWQADKRRGLEIAAAGGAAVRTEWIEGDHDLHAQHPVQIADLLRTLG